MAMLKDDREMHRDRVCCSPRAPRLLRRVASSDRLSCSGWEVEPVLQMLSHSG
jgi:hypothetical protein